MFGYTVQLCQLCDLVTIIKFNCVYEGNKQTNKQTNKHGNAYKFIVPNSELKLIILLNNITCKIQYSEEEEISFLASANGILKANPKSIS